MPKSTRNIKKEPSRDLDVLKFISSYLAKNGFPPSVREVGQQFGYSSSAMAHTMLADVQERGWIITHQKVARGISLTPAGKKALTSAKK
jgi:repressor LexA